MDKVCTFFVAFILYTAVSFSQQLTSYAIRNVNLISMSREGIQSNQTVLVENGTITAVGKDIKLPVNCKVINGEGKYLMPGLFDMHAHFFNEQGTYNNTTEQELKVMLANGLTTVRILAGHPNYLEARRNVKEKKWKGPDLVVASPQFVGRWPWPQDFKNFEITDTKEKAVAAVKRYQQEGYDAIKISFMVKRDVYDAIVSTAREVGIPVTGHVGPLVKLPAALAAKQQIEHLDEFIDMLLPDTSYNHGQSVSDMNLWRMNAWATVPFLDEKKIAPLVKAVKESGIYVTPTNFFFVSCFGTEYTDEVYKARPDYQFIPSAIKEERWSIKDRNRKMNIPKENLDKYVYLRKKMVKDLWEAGVPLMAGSDSPEWFLVPGFSIHDELDMFVEAGLTPYAALKTATVHTADYLGLNKGVIQKGKKGDLLLLDKNPLDNIKNSRSIVGVLKDSEWYDASSLKQMLQEAATILSK